MKFSLIYIHVHIIKSHLNFTTFHTDTSQKEHMFSTNSLTDLLSVAKGSSSTVGPNKLMCIAVGKT
jgi:hypothetical protein